MICDSTAAWDDFSEGSMEKTLSVLKFKLYEK